MAHLEHLRTIRFRPYADGAGPTFTLKMHATDRRDNRGQTYIAYELIERPVDGEPIVLFEGEDFAGSPCHADDSDDTVGALMSFLALRPGDTDADYFESYTADQLAYCEQHAEALGLTADDRFGESRFRGPKRREVAEALRDLDWSFPDETTEDIAIRLQVFRDGDWCLHQGEAGFDTDHRGVWGASEVRCRKDGRLGINAAGELARDLLEQARDQWRQTY
jgi:hypothetical protein